MSVHQESLELADETGATPTAEETQTEASDVEYTELRADSLAMFGAAIGGAILGLLLTLLALALINGGTLNFSGGAEQLAAMEAGLQRVNENVGAVSTNVDIVASQTAANRTELAAAETAFQEDLTVQSQAISANQAAIGVLDQTRTQFDILVTALADALNSMEAVVGAAAESAADFAQETVAIDSEGTAVAEAEADSIAPTEMGLPVPMVANSAELPAQHVIVVLFADANGDGFMDDGETGLMGATVLLLDSAGKAAATATGAEAGARFEELDAGEYEVVVEDALGYELLSQPSAAVIIGDDDSEGFVVYIPASTTAE